jgi:2-C-methyl-D-erythritol 2,4-cyclodiphosphate synthase
MIFNMDFRIGHGYDLHRLREGGKLLLAGVVASQEMSAIAHSDGDVILHAVVDAMLGAIGGGDIGEHFPDTDARWKDAASSLFVKATLNEVKKAGYEIANVDITLIAERPRIKAMRSMMVDSLRHLLGQPQLPVNVKAGTNEGCDAIGRGEAIAAHAVVLLRTVQK